MRTGYICQVTRANDGRLYSGETYTIGRVHDDILEARKDARGWMQSSWYDRVDVVALHENGRVDVLTTYGKREHVPSYTRVQVASRFYFTPRTLPYSILFSDARIEDAACRGVQWCRRIVEARWTRSCRLVAAKYGYAAVIA
jgi:hypothetical protein